MKIITDENEQEDHGPIDEVLIIRLSRNLIVSAI